MARTLLLCTICLLCTACQKTIIDYEKSVPTSKRILIAYLAGDNSLSDEIEQKITALITGFQNTKDNQNNRLFIYCDYRATEPQLIEVTPNTPDAPRRIIKTYPAQNSADATTVAHVLDEVLNNYPATSYGLIFFSHGTAWLPAGALKNPYQSAETESETDTETEVSTRTVATDNSNELELTDFTASLPLPDGKKWAFIVFENCYMGSVEVAYELKDKTDALIASATEVVSPGMTKVYPDALPYLYEEEPALESFAQAYFDHWNAKTGDYRSATISVTRTERLEELATLARAAFLRWQPDEETIASLQHFNRNKWHLFFDLKEALLTANPALQPLVDELLPHIITYAAATPAFIEGEAYGFTLQQHCGLSCYIYQRQFLFLNERHRQLLWGQEASQRQIHSR